MVAIDWQPLAEDLGYSDDKVMLETEYDKCKSLRELDKLLGVSKYAIACRMKHHGLKLNGRGGSNNKSGRKGIKNKKIMELHIKYPECTLSQIAERVGTTNKYVGKVISDIQKQMIG